jgi:hypothetical protein
MPNRAEGGRPLCESAGGVLAASVCLTLVLGALVTGCGGGGHRLAGASQNVALVLKRQNQRCMAWWNQALGLSEQMFPGGANDYGGTVESYFSNPDYDGSPVFVTRINGHCVAQISISIPNATATFLMGEARPQGAYAEATIQSGNHVRGAANATLSGGRLVAKRAMSSSSGASEMPSSTTTAASAPTTTIPLPYGGGDGFTTPIDGTNVLCNYGPVTDGGSEFVITCGAGNKSVRVPPTVPGGVATREPVQWSLLQHGSASFGPVMGNMASGPGMQILGYGKTWRWHGISCVSQTTGLTCKNLDGSGFTLSSHSQRTFTGTVAATSSRAPAPASQAIKDQVRQQSQSQCPIKVTFSQDDRAWAEAAYVPSSATGNCSRYAVYWVRNISSGWRVESTGYPPPCSLGIPRDLPDSHECTPTP